MTLKTINNGAVVNDPAAESIFAAFNDAKTNFAEIYAQLGDGTALKLSAPVSTAATLRLIKGVVDNQHVHLLGGTAPGDGNGGAFYWSSVSTATDDGMTVINPSGNLAGRWLRSGSPTPYAAASAKASAAGPTGQTSKFFPTDAGMYNVKDYGAVGDGVTDDTAAIQAAITAMSGSLACILFFPAGTYLVTQSIRFVSDGVGGTTWKSGIALQGSGAATIKLADYTYMDPANPVPLLWLASQPWSGSNANGQGNNAFLNFVFDLVVDVGVGNSGAIGIAWMGNNVSGMRNVVIKSSDPNHVGYAGLGDYSRYAPGPSLFKDVTIDGFSHAVVWTQMDYGTVFDGLTLVNQTSDQFTSYRCPTVVRRLNSPNAIHTQDAIGLLALADRANARLTLPVQAMPNPAVISSSAPSDYVSVVTYGADKTGSSDSTAAIQTAIDSGHSNVYFPLGTYKVTDTIIIRGSVQRLWGCGSVLVPDAALFSRPSQITADFTASSGSFAAWGGTWNPADKDPGILLSNGNLTATNDVSSINQHLARGTVSFSAGKKFFNVNVDFQSHNNQTSVGFGLANATAVLNSYLGNDLNGLAYFPPLGQIWSGGGPLATIEKMNKTGIVQVAVDTTAKLIWVKPTGVGTTGYWNNSSTANPETGTGGVSYNITGAVFPAVNLLTDPLTAVSPVPVVRPVLRFNGPNDCLIDRLDINGAPSAVSIEHNSSAQLSLRNIMFNLNQSVQECTYRNTSSGTGNLFLEDVSTGGPWSFAAASIQILYPQNVWAWQLNPEGLGTKVLNAGGKLWVLGIKAETQGTVVKTTNGGRSEVIGGLLYPLGADPTNAAFLLTDTATGSFSVASTVYNQGSDFTTYLSAPGKTVTASQLPVRGYGIRAPIGTLFV